jgi:hypothetical protein
MRPILFPIIAVFALPIAGCFGSSMTPLKGPDGQEWVAISCEHGAKSCWKAAGDFCPGGYIAADEVQSTERHLIFASHTKDEMLIRCKNPGDAAEQAARATTPTAQ